MNQESAKEKASEECYPLLGSHCQHGGKQKPQASTSHSDKPEIL